MCSNSIKGCSFGKSLPVGPNRQGGERTHARIQASEPGSTVGSTTRYLTWGEGA